MLLNGAAYHFYSSTKEMLIITTQMPNTNQILNVNALEKEYWWTDKIEMQSLHPNWCGTNINSPLGWEIIRLDN